jgi:hypothetical protein
MAALTKERHFDVLRTVLALAEERRAVPLHEAAAAAGVRDDELRELLAPVLYLEFRTAAGDIVHEEHAFLLTEDGDLVVTGEHWLRDLAADPPPADLALRLLVAALTVPTLATHPTPDLDDAGKKLRGVVAVELQVPVERPPCLATVQDAWRAGRSLRVRYLAEAASAAHDVELLPHRVFCRWGHWYVVARITVESRVRTFRVDRMLDAEVGETVFEGPDDVEIPDWFDLSAHERTVRVRCAPAALDVAPQPHSVAHVRALDDGRVEADVTVAGERRLEHLLVCLPPDAEVLDPPEYADLRRSHARRLLAAYDA